MLVICAYSIYAANSLPVRRDVLCLDSWSLVYFRFRQTRKKCCAGKWNSDCSGTGSDRWRATLVWAADCRRPVVVPSHCWWTSAMKSDVPTLLHRHPRQGSDPIWWQPCHRRILRLEVDASGETVPSRRVPLRTCSPCRSRRRPRRRRPGCSTRRRQRCVDGAADSARSAALGCTIGRRRRPPSWLRRSRPP